MCIAIVAEYITIVEYYYTCRKRGGMSVSRGCFHHPLQDCEECVEPLYIHCILLVNGGLSVAQ